MRALTFLLFLLLPLLAGAKDVPMTSEWSGIWSDADGQHRCAIQIADAYDPSRLTVLCQLGQSGGYANLTPAPSGGSQVFLQQPSSPFGGAPAGQRQWGQITWYAACDASGPAIYGAAYSAPLTIGFTLRPVALNASTRLCGPRIGGVR